MDIRTIGNSLLWGFALWFFGYVLGFVFYAFVPTDIIGWVIAPFGIAATLIVLIKWIDCSSIEEYLYTGILWTLVAIVCDYVFLVLLLHPADGYYKLDVYLYYFLTLFLPVAYGWWKTRARV